MMKSDMVAAATTAAPRRRKGPPGRCRRPQAPTRLVVPLPRAWHRCWPLLISAAPCFRRGPIPVPHVEAEDDQGFGDDDWESATADPANQNGGGPGHAFGIGKIEDITKPLSTGEEDWSLFTSVDDKLNRVHQTTDVLGTHESTREHVKATTYSLANNSAILNLYKESERTDAIQIAQSSAESVHGSSDLFSDYEMMTTIPVDQQLIAVYQRLREESLATIYQHVKDLREAQKESAFSDENSKATAIGRDIQEIYDKLKDSSLPKDFFTEEQPWKDVDITKLLIVSKRTI